MSRIWSMMDIGKRSLSNSQTALQTVGHNIANKTTEGYSRQRVEFQTNQPSSSGNLQIGMGARPSTITRIQNDHLEKQIQKEGSEFAFQDARANAMAQVEQVYNEQVNKGLNRYMAEFFNSFRELSNNPESLAVRNQVKETAFYLTKDFKRVVDQLSDIESDVDFQIKAKVEEVNSMAEEVAKLNEKIKTVEIQGAKANDERDRRELLVKKMGELINIKATEGKDSTVTITAGNTALLVSGFSANRLETRMEPVQGRWGPSVEVYYKSSEKATPVKVTQQVTGGGIGGLLDVRNVALKNSAEQLDTLAYQLAGEVNKAHGEGFSRYGERGIAFFDLGRPAEADNLRLGAADRLKVSQDIMTDVGNIAAAASPNSPGDNRIAHIISQIQYKNAFGDGSTTVDDFYGTMVADVGIISSRANTARDSQKDIVSQLKNIRESISGVSLDEEATKMIEYQKTFDASARLIRTADEMMDTVLNLRRY